MSAGRRGRRSPRPVLPRQTHGTTLRTSEGPFTAKFTDTGLCALVFPPERRQGRSAHAPADLPEPFRTWAVTTASTLEALLAGKEPSAWPPLDLSGGTPFQREVWRALREIPQGETRTYAELAAAIGRPQGARAVGQACGANPVPILVPCHRVRAAGGGLGGFSGGLRWKRLLLAREVR